MKKAVLKLVAVYVVFLMFFMLQRLLFLCVYQNEIHATAGEWLQALAHGFSMDCSVAGYLSVIPGMFVIAGLWLPVRGVAVAERVYYGIVSLALAAITILDLILYGYWGFRLDMTPVFYFSTSPSAAMASAEWWHLPVGLAVTGVIGVGLYRALCYVARRFAPGRDRRGATAAVMALATGLMFIPIRGGFTVSTMNLSRAYFSTSQRLNHAAINPAFSLLYSATHQHDFGSRYRFMDDSEAERLLALLDEQASDAPGVCGTDVCEPTAYNNLVDSTLLTYRRPHIYLIILESFSSHLMPSLGGEPVAVGLDSLARTGVSFTNIYASSFRTDRALPAILSAFPGQPSMSLMKYVEKIESLPSISAELAAAGYAPSYYYGGDINFTNMNAYLVHSGFGTIVSDKDFPLSEKTGKWGAPDHVLFEKVLADARSRRGGSNATPEFNVIQTSSSHEPFEVPHTSGFQDKRLNAFAYTDSCLAAFVNELAALPDFDRTLVVIVPDHYGAYPDRPEDPLDRHRVPLVLTGGVLEGRCGTVDAVGSQTDIAATLMGLLGLPSEAFVYSHDLLTPGRRGYAFFSEPGIIGLVTPSDTVVLECDAMQTLQLKGSSPACAMSQVEAYLQSVYSRITDM